MDPPAPRHAAKEVGDAFVEQYYYVLQDHPENLPRFYKDSSMIGRPGNDGKIRSSTLSHIDENLNMLSSGGFDSAEVTSVTSHDSISGGVFLVVNGYFTLNEERLKRNFTQVFFLEPQEKGYDVLNDMFHFDGIPIPNDTEEKVAETQASHNEVADGSLMVAEPNDGLLDGFKLSEDSKYRNIEPLFPGSRDRFEVHVKNLPIKDTVALLKKALEQFGRIKKIAIQRSDRSPNFRYGFVEFEEADAAERAVAATYVMVGERRVPVSRKRGYAEKKRRKEERRQLIHAFECRQHNQNRYIAEQLRVEGVYDFWDWLESMEKHSKLQGERGVYDHSWDYEEVMEEHRKFQEEQRKFQEEYKQFQEEQRKLDEEEEEEENQH